MAGSDNEMADGPRPLQIAPPALRLQIDPADVGARLRAARVARERTLQEVASVTKISVRALEAIEANDASRLPGGIFSRGFVKTYAEHLGLDPTEMVQLFLARFPEVTPAEEQVVSAWQAHATAKPSRDITVASFIAPLAVVGALLFAGAALYWVLSGPASPKETEAAAASGPAANASAPAAILAPPPADPAFAASGATQQSDKTGGNSGRDAAASGLPDPSGMVAAALAKEQLEIAIEAIAPCWVRVMIDGEVAFARVMRQGERENRVASDQIVLDVGDAGAFRYSVNGVPGRWLGRKGQVITARISRDTLATFLQQ